MAKATDSLDLGKKPLSCTWQHGLPTVNIQNKAATQYDNHAVNLGDLSLS